MFLRDTTEAIWAFTGTVLGLIVCVGIASILRQVRHNSEGSSQADKWENATDAVMGFIDGDETRMGRFSKLLQSDETRPIVIEALSNVARTTANCAVHLRDRDADVAILRSWVSTSLEDKDAGRRAHACEVVGTLRLRACRGMVLAATGDEDVNVKVSATRAMAVIDPESAVGVLLGLIEEEGAWAADLLADVLQRIPAQATEAVVQRARDFGATPALVKLLASSPSALANDVLLGALETDDAELRARTAEAVHASTPQAVAALCGLLTDPHEGTRLSAVRSLGRAANPEALLTLSSALSDTSRLVRFAAASGIAATPGGGDFLSRVVTGTDANAAEAAELALWRLNSGALAATIVPTEELLSAILTTEPADSSASEAVLAEATPVDDLTTEDLIIEDLIIEDLIIEDLITEDLTDDQEDLSEEFPLGSVTAVVAEAIAETKDEAAQSPAKNLAAVPSAKRTAKGSTKGSAKPAVQVPSTALSPKPKDKPGTASRARSTPAPSPKRAAASEPLAQLIKPSSSTVGVAPTTRMSSPKQNSIQLPLEPTVDAQPRTPLRAPEPALERREAASPRTSVAALPKVAPARRFDEVLLWLDEYLRAHGGVASAPVVKAAAARAGIAERTLERVRPTIASSARQGFGEPANWELLELKVPVSA